MFTILHWIRGNTPHFVYHWLHYGWIVLSLLTLIAVVDMCRKLFRSEHGLKP